MPPLTALPTPPSPWLSRLAGALPTNLALLQGLAQPGLLPPALPQGRGPGGGQRGGPRLPGAPRAAVLALRRPGSSRHPAPGSLGPTRLLPRQVRPSRAAAAHWAGRGSSSCSGTGAAQPGRRVCGAGAACPRLVPPLPSERSGAERRRRHRRARPRHLPEVSQRPGPRRRLAAPVT